VPTGHKEQPSLALEKETAGAREQLRAEKGLYTGRGQEEWFDGDLFVHYDCCLSVVALRRWSSWDVTILWGTRITMLSGAMASLNCLGTTFST
jgi:hypothetical protein